MARLALMMALAVLAATGCNTESTHERTYLDGYSIDSLEGWDYERQNGSDVFRAPGEASRVTIAVRSVERKKPLSDDDAEIARATRDVLAGLPGARGVEHATTDRALYPAEELSLTFEPRNAAGRYARLHVVVFAEDHVYHVLHTGPVGQLDKTEKDLERVVSSLREEG